MVPKKNDSLISLLVFFSLIIGCGYHFKHSHNELYFKEKVQTIYIAPVLNNTYQPGVEIIVYNHLVKTFSSQRRGTLVYDEAEADGILKSSVKAADYSVSASTQLLRLKPEGFSGLGLGHTLPEPNRLVATEYVASLICDFQLVRNPRFKHDKAVIWSSSFPRVKPFPASNQLGVPGTTSALINQSEFERTLFELSKNMVDDVHESLFSMF